MSLEKIKEELVNLQKLNMVTTQKQEIYLTKQSGSSHKIG